MASARPDRAGARGESQQPAEPAAGVAHRAVAAGGPAAAARRDARGAACPGIAAALGRFPRERVNPNGGSVALGHPFGATGARILSQAIKELAALPSGSRAIVSICADGGQGTVALLQH